MTASELFCTSSTSACFPCLTYQTLLALSQYQYPCLFALQRVCCRELAQMAISAGLISEADGNAIKELLKKGPVSVALNWTDVLPKANQVSEQQQQCCQQVFVDVAVPAAWCSQLPCQKAIGHINML